MAVRLIKKSWWVNFWFNHTRYRRRSPENTRAGAKAYEAVLRQRLARGEPVDGIDERAETPKFREFAWRWFNEYVMPNNKYSEQLNRKYIIDRSLVPFFGNLRVAQITSGHVEQYKSKLVRDGISRKTINNRLSILNTCLATASEWLRLDTPPPKIKRLKCPPPCTEYLAAEEAALLLKGSTGTTHELILTALRTGMRQGELKGLQWESIDWPSGNLVVRHSRCDYRKVLDTPKSNRERHIPLDREVYETLAKRRRPTGYVFTDEEGRPFNAYGMSQRLTEACVTAGIRRITWHVLRHTFASELAIKGVPLHAVQTLLGHTTIMTTMRYSHVAPSALRTAIDLLDPQKAPRPDFGQPAGNRWQGAWNTA